MNLIGGMTKMKKIDIHAHTTNRPFHGVSGAAGLDALAEKMKEHDVEKTVVLATYFPHRGSGISNFRMLNWVQDRPEFEMFGSLDFENYFNQGYNELSELLEGQQIKGIKVYTTYQEVDLGSDNFARLVELAKKYRAPMVFHCGNSYSSMRKYGRPAIRNMVKASDLEFVAQENPEIDVIAAHMSKPYFNELAEVVNRNENFYTDMSGLISSHSEAGQLPYCARKVRQFLERCGSGKLMFGTDFPVQTHEDSVYIVEEAMKGFSDRDKQDVYYNNARRILKL